MMANELITVGSNSHKKIKTLKILGSLLTYQNYIREEIKCRLTLDQRIRIVIQTKYFCLLNFFQMI
jgi:hypothetical protein